MLIKFHSCLIYGVNVNNFVSRKVELFIYLTICAAWLRVVQCCCGRLRTTIER
jgi:hypothetical protein